MRQSSVRDLLNRAADTLRDAGVPTPEVDARLLAAHILGVAPLEVNFADATDDFEARFGEAIARRAAREPLQHITGTAPFGPLDLAVGPGVFIPRPETELLADFAVHLLLDDSPNPHPAIIDLGTGSGALAIYLAHHIPDATVYAVERSDAARAYAQRNADTHAPQVRVVEGDMTDPGLLAELHGSVDLVVSNPPYVPETPELDAEIYADPAEAVFSGADGMEAIEGLVPVAKQLLKSGGHLAVEHDDSTSNAVREVIRAAGGFSEPQAHADLTGRARFVSASKL